MLQSLLEALMPYISELAIAVILWLIRLIEKRALKKKFNQELTALKDALKKKRGY